MSGTKIHKITFLLVIIGALNWGIIGFFNFGVIGWAFGTIPYLERIIYALVGVSAIYLLLNHKDECQTCTSKTTNKEEFD